MAPHAKLSYSTFHSVKLCLATAIKYSYLFIWEPNICKSRCLINVVKKLVCRIPYLGRFSLAYKVNKDVLRKKNSIHIIVNLAPCYFPNYVNMPMDCGNLSNFIAVALQCSKCPEIPLYRLLLYFLSFNLQMRNRKLLKKTLAILIHGHADLWTYTKEPK